MKRNNVLRISILPLVVLTVLAFANMQPGKNKNDQGQSEAKGKNEAREGQSQRTQGDNKNQNDSRGQKSDQSHENSNQGNKGQGNNNHSDKGQGSDDHMQGNKGDREKGHDMDKKGSSDKGDDHSDKDNWDLKRGNGNSKTMNGKRDGDIDWGFNDFANRKGPGKQQKVNICHNPSGDDSGNYVTINVSENAVKAHMNHGDQMGECKVDYSDRWSSDYNRSRENVYNTYEQTWETMSYSEALLRFAADKLLGVKSNLSTNRATLSSQEIQRRELLINDLQNNVSSLENQLGQTRQRMDSNVNIIVQL